MSHRRDPGLDDSLAVLRVIAALRRDLSARQLVLQLGAVADRSAEVGEIRNRLNRLASAPEAGEPIDPVRESLRSAARARQDLQLRQAERLTSAAQRDVTAARLALQRAQAGCDALAELHRRQVDAGARRIQRQAAALADDDWLRRSQPAPWGRPGGRPWGRER